MHAAASYAQLDVLAYLVQQGNTRIRARSHPLTIVSLGGDVNITDEDGDTPLYTVENIDTARWLIDHGAVIDRRNGAGVPVSAPCQHPTSAHHPTQAHRAPRGGLPASRCLFAVAIGPLGPFGHCSTSAVAAFPKRCIRNPDV